MNGRKLRPIPKGTPRQKFLAATVVIIIKHAISTMGPMIGMTAA
jgi:hypothetical protein